MLKKFFVVALICLFSVSFAETVSVLSTDVEKLKKALSEETNKSRKIYYEIRLMYLTQPSSVDSLEKIKAVFAKGGLDEKLVPSNMLLAVKTIAPNKKLASEAFEKYKQSAYAKEFYVLKDYPNKYSDQEIREAALFVLDKYSKVKTMQNRERNFSIAFDKYVEVTKNTDVEKIKNDILPIYRRMSIKIAEDSSFKNATIKLGLLLRSCGVDVK